MNCLYHYTTEIGLKGILQDGGIRFTDYKDVKNDKKELQHAKHILRPIIKKIKKVDNKSADKIYDLILSSLEQTMSGIFLFCATNTALQSNHRTVFGKCRIKIDPSWLNEKEFLDFCFSDSVRYANHINTIFSDKNYKDYMQAVKNHLKNLGPNLTVSKEEFIALCHIIFGIKSSDFLAQLEYRVILPGNKSLVAVADSKRYILVPINRKLITEIAVDKNSKNELKALFEREHLKDFIELIKEY